ncbi:MAG TPA: hypothetical protein VE863_10770, partial [Pyrinomonadaceae bacterium]|nr:hypothetical protein [Pyrinomonadaceae bacterium]
MATEKSIDNKEREERNQFEQTDPIIVGGGGSTYILINKSINTKLVDAPASVFGPNVGNYFAI